MKRGFFLVIDGPDGSGKSTQAARLKTFLEGKGWSVVHTREPGGTAFAENVRSILLDPAHRVRPLAELLLYQAARAQHTAELIRPALEKGKFVICERFTDATLAYQGYGRGIDLGLIRVLSRISTEGLAPRLSIFLDLPAREGLKRARRSGKGGRRGDRLERERLAFHERVRRGYLALAKKNPRRILLVRAKGDVQAVQQKLRAAVLPRLLRRR